MFKITFYVLLSLFMFTGCERDSRVEVKKKKVGEVELAYYTRGSGEPLIMIMGFRGDMALWDPALIEELAKHYTVIPFDSRGVGLSTDTKENKTTIKQMADDTVGLIKALGYQKVHLLGWSMGSSIALQVALDQPEILKTLILCAPNPGGTHQAVLKDVYNKLTSSTTSKEDLLALMFPENAQGRAAAQSFIVRIKKESEKGQVPTSTAISQETMNRQAGALKLRSQDNHLHEGLSQIKVRTLVAGGLEDVIDPSENTRAVACQIPFAWSAYFPGAGHGFISQDHLNLSRLIDLFIQADKN